MTGQESRLLGQWGEALAAEFLRKQGYRIVAAGWRCRFGELDLVVEGFGFLCFVEVKLRRSQRFGGGAEYVDARKQQRLRMAAQQYLREHPTDLQPRFDVMELLAPQGMQTEQPQIRHLENAFFG